MSDPLLPGYRPEGEYTDSELPLDAALPKEEYEEVKEVLDRDENLDDDLDDGLADDETDVEVIEIVDDDRTYPPGRDTL
jgi:hypothetical protein